MRTLSPERSFEGSIQPITVERVHESMAEDAFEGDSFVGGVGMLSGHKISDDSRTPEYGVRINASMKREGITGTVVLTQI